MSDLNNDLATSVHCNTRVLEMPQAGKRISDEVTNIEKTPEQTPQEFRDNVHMSILGWTIASAAAVFCVCHYVSHLAIGKSIAFGIVALIASAVLSYLLAPRSSLVRNVGMVLFMPPALAGYGVYYFLKWFFGRY